MRIDAQPITEELGPRDLSTTVKSELGDRFHYKFTVTTRDNQVTSFDVTNLKAQINEEAGLDYNSNDYLIDGIQDPSLIKFIKFMFTYDNKFTSSELFINDKGPISPFLEESFSFSYNPDSHEYNANFTLTALKPEPEGRHFLSRLITKGYTGIYKCLTGQEIPYGSQIDELFGEAESLVLWEKSITGTARDRGPQGTDDQCQLVDLLDGDKVAPYITMDILRPLTEGFPEIYERNISIFVNNSYRKAIEQIRNNPHK